MHWWYTHDVMCHLAVETRLGLRTMSPVCEFIIFFDCNISASTIHLIWLYGTYAAALAAVPRDNQPTRIGRQLSHSQQIGSNGNVCWSRDNSIIARIKGLLGWSHWVSAKRAPVNKQAIRHMRSGGFRSGPGGGTGPLIFAPAPPLFHGHPWFFLQK